MKNTVTLSALFTTVLVLAGVSLFLLREQGVLRAEIALQATGRVDQQGTLVAVFAERRAESQAAAAELETLSREVERQATLAAVLAPAATMAAAQEAVPTPRPPAAEDIQDEPPQVRIILRERESIWPVGEPIDIIASAAHPLGIALLNIAVNGENLLADSPLDPRMNIAAVRWTPPAVGTYLISAIATSIRGRTSAPVTIEILVVDDSDPDAVTESILRRIERNVEEIRGLRGREEIEVAILSPDQIEASIRENLFADYTREEADQEVLVLNMFDFLPEGFPLYDNLIESLGQAIAGYYDPPSNTLFVVRQGEELEEETRLTHAHEYLHALQDQYFELALLEEGDLDKDQRLALRSLGEGEAELVEFLYRSRGYLTGEQGADSSPVFPTPVIADVPDFLLSDFTFPYVRGFAFVNHFYEQGAFNAVDQLWARRPLSSEQIIHPERYAAGDDPQPVVLPDLGQVLGNDWTLLDADVFGEFYLREYLSQRLDAAAVDTAATGWGGDRYAVYRRSTDGARLLIFQLVWDQPSDRDEFTTAYRQWGDSRNGRAAGFEVDGGRCWTQAADSLCLYETPGGHLILRGAPFDVLTAAAGRILNP